MEGCKDSSASYSLFLSWDRDRNRGMYCTCSQVKGKVKLKLGKTEREGEKITFCLEAAVLEILVWCNSSWTGSVLCLHSPPAVTLTFYSLPLPLAALLPARSGERLPLCFSPSPNPNPCPGSGWDRVNWLPSSWCSAMCSYSAWGWCWWHIDGVVVAE